MDLEQTLLSVREPLQADGADLALISYNDGVVSLRLVLDNVECMECILPKDHLEKVILSQLRNSVPGVQSVALEDPR